MRQVLDLLRAKAAELPSLLLALGGGVPLAMTVGEIYSLFEESALGPLLEGLYGPDGQPPVPTPTGEALVWSVGLDFDPAWDAEADRLLDAAQIFFEVPE